MAQEGKNNINSAPGGTPFEGNVPPEEKTRPEESRSRKDIKKAYKRGLLGSIPQSPPEPATDKEKPILSEVRKEDLTGMLKASNTLKDAQEIYETFGEGVMARDEFNKLMREWQKTRQEFVESHTKTPETVSREEDTEIIEKTTVSTAKTETPQEPLTEQVPKPAIKPIPLTAETSAPDITIPKSVLKDTPAKVSVRETAPTTFVEEPMVEAMWPEEVPSPAQETETRKGVNIENYSAIRNGLNRAIEILRQNEEALNVVLGSPQIEEAFLTAFFSGELKLDPEDVKMFLEEKDKKTYVKQHIGLIRTGLDALKDGIWKETDPLKTFRYQVKLLLSSQEANNILREIEKARVSLVLQRVVIKAKTEAAEEMADKTRRQAEEIKMVRGALGFNRRSRWGKHGRRNMEEDIRDRIVREGEQLSEKKIRAEIYKGLERYNEEKALAEELLQRLVAEPGEFKSLKESLLSAGAYEEARELERQVRNMKETEERKRKYEELMPRVAALWEGAAEGQGLKQKIKEFVSGEENSFENIRDELVVLSGLLGELEKVMPWYRPPITQFYTGERFQKRNVRAAELPAGMEINTGERFGLKLKPGETVTIEKLREALRSYVKRGGRSEREKESENKQRKQIALVGEATRAMLESIPKGDKLAPEKGAEVFRMLGELQDIKKAIERKPLAETELQKKLRSVAKRIGLIVATEEELKRRIAASEKSGRFVPLSELEREEKKSETRPKKKGGKRGRDGEEPGSKKTNKRGRKTS